MRRCAYAEACGYGGCPLEPPPDARYILDWVRAAAYVRMLLDDGKTPNPRNVARQTHGDRRRALAVIAAVRRERAS